MRTSSFEWIADDGKPIFVHVFSPDEGTEVRGVVHVSHGMSEHGARYTRLAEALTTRGLVVEAHDHRGHGSTAKSDDELGYFGPGDGFGRVVADLRGLIARARTAYPGLKQALLGHSMGSLIAQGVLPAEGGKLGAVLLSGTNGPPSLMARAGVLVAKAERARLGERGKSVVIQGMSFDAWNRTFSPNRTPYDWLSRDAAEVDKYVADARCGFSATTTLWVQLLGAMGTLARPDALARLPKDLPICVVAGSEDPVHERTKNLRGLLDAYAKAGLSDVTYRVYPGARHELFNETNRDEVIREASEWLVRKLAR
ncbi:alpha/beta fold hydrolase [Polyangium mundeleinium]|uniref:Alpha/beta hydrolase n=1 Tax=Polyangium mundeleinium TaxID=2995306 RepID=A0ABT5EXU8_9BACT|nr:alpha/beta hydrolase [Polyangium mundeleinium]MDC0745645.1 alpha/beta hydrolase [Polyangium mundeleinium]